MEIRAKAPPRQVIHELKKRGFSSFEWQVYNEDGWLAYCKLGSDYVVVTVNVVTGKWIVEVLSHLEQFDIESVDAQVFHSVGSK